MRKKQNGITSIIIVTRNGLHLTKKCIQSIKKHTSDLNEIIFVDNGSKDDTLNYLNSLSQTKVISNPHNYGFAKACNQGIAASSGEFIVLLNNDTVVSKDWLNGLKYWLEKDPSIGVVGPRAVNVGNNQNISDPSYSFSHMNDYASSLRKRHFRTGFEAETLSGFCLVMRKNLIHQIGGFDERFYPGTFEDEDFCLRTKILGKKLWVSKDVFIHHSGGESFTKNNENYNKAFTENRLRFLKKWQPHRFKTRKELIINEQPFNYNRHYIPLKV